MEPPALPPKIELINDTHRNGNLTERKQQLQRYLREVLKLMAFRLPPHLLVFLGLVEQKSLGYSSSAQIQKLAGINIKPSSQDSLPEVTVPESKIQFFNDEPKTTYMVTLRYKPFTKHDDAGEAPLGGLHVAMLTSFKVYGDFKRLNEFVRCTQLTRDDGRLFILPQLPTKLDENGFKKNDGEMREELQTYMQELLKIPKVARMLFVRHFFMINEVQIQRQP